MTERYASKTLDEWTNGKSQIICFSLADFLAKVSRTPAIGRVSRTLAERYSSTLPKLSRLNDLSFYSLKTLGDSYRPKADGVSSRYLRRWMSWGMMSNGKCLTANISGFRKTDPACSLSDILETDVPDKYFLSQQAIKTMINWAKRQKENNRGFQLAIFHRHCE